ncbi:preprotein translocase [Paenibacillus selenitireducens]|uniref:Preprotein translocase n=1 Tax=Paenibacillus selenitireducens TaxID=1324314 RepID=A0A1T2X280_9BACL|nr:DHHW family protein [Paenibacillus selenitireducens]OPA73972.1 preprotein translocase [Paenibacillus selenitireducens]
MTNKRAVWLTVCFVAYIVVFGAWSLITPDRKLSEFENRALAQLPQFTTAKLWDGRYTSQMEDYLADQFVNRDMWVGIKSDAERTLGKTENNNVFFGQHNYLFERFAAPDGLFHRNVESIRTFAKRHQDTSVYMLIVPQSEAVYPDMLPPYASATSYSPQKVIDHTFQTLKGDIVPIPVLDLLKAHRQESVYFRTDHHWTMRGAYYGYEAFARAAGLEPVSLNALASRVLSDTFYGTYYTKANNKHIQPDTIELLEQPLPPYQVCYSDSQTCTDSFYHLDALKQRDHYAVFFNGNRAWTTITTSNPSGRSIAVFKDSYANDFVPYLAKHYTRIDMIDMRFFRDNVDDYLKQHQLQDILLLYGAKTVAEDDIFKWLN